MSKAEERYLEYFQDGRVRNCSSKEAFLLGYQQAEKDLELTLEDMKFIYEISCDTFNEHDGDFYNISKIWKEVLKRFKEHNKL